MNEDLWSPLSSERERLPDCPNVFQERIREVGSCSSDAFLCPSHYTPGFRGPEVPLGNLDLPGLVVEGASQSWRGERLFPPLAEDFFSQMNNSL